MTQELPDIIRIPLHELQADVGYLIGRVVADGSSAGMVIDTFKKKLAMIEAAVMPEDTNAYRSKPVGIFADPRDGIMLRFENNRVRKITAAERIRMVASLSNETSAQPQSRTEPASPSQEADRG